MIKHLLLSLILDIFRYWLFIQNPKVIEKYVDFPNFIPIIYNYEKPTYKNIIVGIFISFIFAPDISRQFCSR